MSETRNDALGPFSEHGTFRDSDWLIPDHGDYVCQNCGALVCGHYRAAHRVSCPATRESENA